MSGSNPGAPNFREINLASSSPPASNEQVYPLESSVRTLPAQGLAKLSRVGRPPPTRVPARGPANATARDTHDVTEVLVRRPRPVWSMRLCSSSRVRSAATRPGGAAGDAAVGPVKVARHRSACRDPRRHGGFVHTLCESPRRWSRRSKGVAVRVHGATSLGRSRRLKLR